MNFSQTKTSIDDPEQGSSCDFIKGEELNLNDELDNLLEFRFKSDGMDQYLWYKTK